MPLALRIWFEEVGQVDLNGTHAEWSFEYPDPLVVYPPSAAISELNDFLDDRDERIRCGFRYVVPIAPDDAHKENVSGGMWYNLSVPAVADDPEIEKYAGQGGDDESAKNGDRGPSR